MSLSLQTVTLKQDGPTLRLYRKLCRIALGTSAAARYETHQQDAVARFVRTMTEHHALNPAGDTEFMPQVRLSAIRSIMGMLYGIQVEDANHEVYEASATRPRSTHVRLTFVQYVKIAEASVAYFAKAIQPGRYLVDTIPIRTCRGRFRTGRDAQLNV